MAEAALSGTPHPFPDAWNGAKRSGRRSGTQPGDSPRSGSTVEFAIEVAPVRVHVLDQFQLPRAPPLLHRIFAVTGIEDAVVSLVSDEHVDAVVARETRLQLALVLPDAAREVGRRADMKGAVAAARQDVDVSARLHS
jgi:hypothetical protein